MTKTAKPDVTKESWYGSLFGDLTATVPFLEDDIARRIIQTFGEKTLVVIRESPTFLTQVRGVTPKVVEMIRHAFESQNSSRQVFNWLVGLGVEPNHAAAIGDHVAVYGGMRLFTANPIALCRYGIPFAVADKLWIELGFPADSPIRAAAAAKYNPVARPANAPGGHPGYLALLDEMRALHLRKAADYGRGADPLANCRASAEFGVPAWVGTMIRACDKVHRIKSFRQNGTLANEGVRDSLMDLAAYALIALALFDEQEAGKAVVA